MTTKNFFRYYNKLNGADRYFLIFKYDGFVFLADLAHICPNWCDKTHESTKNGGWEKWKINASKLPKARLAKKAVKIMTVKEFEMNSHMVNNRGDYCEKWLCENYECVPSSSKRNARFDECGDVTFKGLQYQVKFENASLTNVNVLHKAQKSARERA